MSLPHHTRCIALTGIQSNPNYLKFGHFFRATASRERSFNMHSDANTVRRGQGQMVSAPDLPVIINPSINLRALSQSRQPRWMLSPALVGVVERLAGTRYVVQNHIKDEVCKWKSLEKQGKKLNGDDPPIVHIDSPLDVINPLAQSVWCSTAIEGESIYAEDVPLAITGQTNMFRQNDPEYLERAEGTRALYSASVWALTHPFPLEGGRVVSPAFILELHRRMFTSTKPSVAGRLKDKDNRIEYNKKTVFKTLPQHLVEEYLDALCVRIDSLFAVADTSARYSKLLAVAEFIVDFLAIHPFGDGNGRAARLLSTYLLERAGYHFARFYPLDKVIDERRKQYYHALLSAQNNWCTEREDLTPWIQFYLESVLAQWLRAHEEIKRISSSIAD